MTGPATTNQTATEVNSVIKSSGGTIVTVTEGLIVADVPWLGTPIVKQIWEAIFNWIASYFIKAAQTGATFAVIDVQVDSEESNISKALSALVAAEKSGDQNAIQTAIKNYQLAQSAIVNDDGSASPQ